MIRSSEFEPSLAPSLPTASTPRRGKHKIFIGMAPGVGKTYRMLEEAQALKQEGFDVVIGLLETHGREETAQKAAGLEQIPLQELIWEGRSLREMDTAAILARRPHLVLVDELAHTNMPGSEREKRYQDVAVILTAGIDVYSTLNIQHLESLNDLVYKISGIVMRERVPDLVIDEADEVIVVDITPETLQERLRDGKIYALEKVDQALQNFFKRQNLVALRELALREVADNIEENNRNKESSDHCTIQERILICISTYPNSIQLLRRGARLANQMNSRLFVLFVSNPHHFLSKTEALHIETCQRLTQEFEGEFIRQEADHVVEAIAQVAQTHRITQIVLGETRRSRWYLLFKGSIVQRLMQLLPSIDIHIIATR